MLRKEHIAAKIYRDLTWHFAGKENEIFLTFDDGPTPGITPWVLDVLDKFEAKATFFCIGKNVQKHPDLYKEILKRGHSVGNHTNTHIKGWRASNKKYKQNIEKAAKVINSNLFRPPYGRIRPRQISSIKQDFKIIMWDVLTKDYDRKVSEEECFRNTLDYSESGSIVVFHDIKKAEKNIKYALPKLLQHYSEQGFIFNSIAFKSK